MDQEQLDTLHEELIKFHSMIAYYLTAQDPLPDELSSSLEQFLPKTRETVVKMERGFGCPPTGLAMMWDMTGVPKQEE